MIIDMTEKHNEFPNFVRVSSVDVDSGSIWVGDPCYIIRDKDEERPKDLGENWHSICDRFSERSGYNERNSELSSWDFKRQMYLFEHSDWKEWRKTKGDGKHHDVNSEAYREKRAVIQKIYDEFEKKEPFKPTSVDKGFANFTHDGGHGGMGTMISTFYGDGGYPVYIEYGKNGRPRRVLIDFDPGGEDEDGNDEA